MPKRSLIGNKLDFLVPDFIIMNEDGEFFAGLVYGGQLMWTSDISEAKPLDCLDKLNTIRRMCKKELIYQFVNEKRK